MSSNEPFQILVADDNFLNRRLLQELLGRRGYSVHPVRDGAEAIQALELGSFDLVILDCLMPGTDGFTASRTIRAADPSRLNPEIPILALTALTSQEVREKCLQAGMDHYICKPFLAETLFQHVEELLRQRVSVESKRFGESSDNVAGQAPGASGDERLDPTVKVKDVFKTMSDRVAHDIVQWQGELKENLERQAFDDIRLLAHKIRGTADLLEWRDLSELSAQLEWAAESGHQLQVTSLARELLDSLARCLQSVPAVE